MLSFPHVFKRESRWVVARVGSRQNISGTTGEKKMEVMKKDRVLNINLPKFRYNGTIVVLLIH